MLASIEEMSERLRTMRDAAKSRLHRARSLVRSIRSRHCPRASIKNHSIQRLSSKHWMPFWLFFGIDVSGRWDISL